MKKFFDLYGHNLGTINENAQRILRARKWKLLKRLAPLA